jgi:hypothetical protein
VPDTAELPARTYHFSNAQIARQAALLSVQARRTKAEQRASQSALDEAMVQALPVDDFTVRKLARVRGQIDQVEKLLDKADEPQAVDRFCNALTRLYDVERILAGRPLPGSRRPKDERGPRASAGWIELQPVAPGDQPQVAPAQPARPMGWEYDTPAADLDPLPKPPVHEPLPGDVTP